MSLYNYFWHKILISRHHLAWAMFLLQKIEFHEEQYNQKRQLLRFCHYIAFESCKNLGFCYTSPDMFLAWHSVYWHMIQQLWYIQIYGTYDTTAVIDTNIWYIWYNSCDTYKYMIHMIQQLWYIQIYDTYDTTAVFWRVAQLLRVALLFHHGGFIFSVQRSP